MIHLGDITKIDGSKIPFVNCITFGSPCQDLSIAGARKGFDGERSVLFLDAVRIIKQMMEASCGRYPNFAVWENVPGAFSSNKGNDFRTVLEELARIKDPEVSIPGSENGRWAKAGIIAGDSFSIAWRTLDAQFWGVPQRRRRIALVVDFGGQRAGEILFERTGMSRDTEPSIPPWKGIARNPAHRATGHDRMVEGSGDCLTPWDVQSRRIYDDAGKFPPIYAGEGGGRGYVIKKAIPINDKATRWKGGGSSRNHDGFGNGLGIGDETDPMFTLTAGDKHAVLCRAQANSNAETCENLAPTLTTCHDGPPIVFEARGNGGGTVSPTITRDHESRVTDYTAICLDCRNARVNNDISGTIQAKPNGGFSYNYINPVCIKKIRWIVRRLTPTECERLQGYPDGWTDIGDWTDSKGKRRKAADTPRYKALGNSIALPQWWWITCKMARYLPDHATLGSLFDGIGGFPLVWETLHGKGTALWASEIEEFPIAVTKTRFGTCSQKNVKTVDLWRNERGETK